MIAKLILKDGTILEGESFGALLNSSGEVVFSTGMVGYPETLTDPSFYGQVLVMTYPLIGNYGVPDKSYFESKQIWIKGLIVQNYIDSPSHFESKQTLSTWLKSQNIPAISGIDTRALTIKLRDQGVMLGKIEAGATLSEQYDPNLENVLPFVSRSKIEVFGTGKKNVVLIDCGAKENIIRSLVRRGMRVTVVPWDFDPIKQNLNFDGVILSNGPGDPQKAVQTIETTRGLLSQRVPVFGICLGNQILALAAGGATYKLKFGHRGQNQPCQNVFTKRAIMTSQNHGFAVDPKSLGQDWDEWFINLNDGSNEGIRHKTKPFFSTQFHPESSPGPVEAKSLFDEFVSIL